jgi:hypothetical protein
LKTLALALACCACGGHHEPSTRLVLRVTDHDVPVGARVLLLAADGTPLHLGTIDKYGERQSAGACEFAPGVIGTWDGIVLAYGRGEVPVGGDHCAIPYGTTTSGRGAASSTSAGKATSICRHSVARSS